VYQHGDCEIGRRGREVAARVKGRKDFIEEAMSR